VHSRDLCNAHYQQQRQGKPLKPLQQYISKSDMTAAEVFGMYAIRQEGCWGWAGTTNSAGYSNYSHGGKQAYAHRLSYEIHIGPIPEGKFIDHMCFNRSCVNPAHLQPVTNKQNHENRPGPQANNTSGVRGVSWNKRGGFYEAYVTHWNTRRRVGNFATLEEAEAAVIAKRNELFTNNLLDRAKS
jgi:hypothetical protein